MKMRVGLRTNLAQEILADLQKGTAGAPKIEIYEGSMPANIGDTIGGNLLAEFEMPNSVGTVTDGVLTFDPIPSDPAANQSGVAGFGRALDRDGAEILYLSVSIAGGPGDIQLSTLSLSAGQPVTITSGVIRAGQ